MTNEECVLDYINHYPHGTLYFKDSAQEELAKLKEYSLWDCIEKILELTEYNNSHVKIGDRLVCDTHSNKTRSSFDIWRHILSIKPDTSIFEVLREMYNNQEELVGHYCGSVYRMVFRLRKIMNNERNEMWGLYTDDGTEYGVDFEDWESIGL